MRARTEMERAQEARRARCYSLADRAEYERDFCGGNWFAEGAVAPAQDVQRIGPRAVTLARVNGKAAQA